ncbi:MAG: hypothetical protein ABEJ86_04470 [Halococcoides sp.]
MAAEPASFETVAEPNRCTNGEPSATRKGGRPEAVQAAIPPGSARELPTPV